MVVRVRPDSKKRPLNTARASAATSVATEVLPLVISSDVSWPNSPIASPTCAAAKSHVAGAGVRSGTSVAALPKPGLKRKRDVTPSTKTGFLARRVRRCNDEDNNRVLRLHLKWAHALDWGGKTVRPIGGDHSYIGPREMVREQAGESVADGV
jgi:hypothetical protein